MQLESIGFDWGESINIVLVSCSTVKQSRPGRPYKSSDQKQKNNDWCLTLSSLTTPLQPQMFKSSYLGFLSSVLGHSKDLRPNYILSEHLYLSL